MLCCQSSINTIHYLSLHHAIIFATCCIISSAGMNSPVDIPMSCGNSGMHQQKLPFLFAKAVTHPENMEGPFSDTFRFKLQFQASYTVTVFFTPF